MSVLPKDEQESVDPTKDRNDPSASLGHRQKLNHPSPIHHLDPEIPAGDCISIDNCLAAFDADELSGGESSAVVPPAAVGAADPVSGRAARGGDDFSIRVAPHRLGADSATHRFPFLPVPIPRNQRVRDFVQNRIANLRFAVEQRERPRERDKLLLLPARAKAPASMIELERPASELMLGHQRDREFLRFGEIHET